MAYIAFFKNAMSCLNYILRGSEDHNIPPRIIFEIEAFRCTAAAPENICAKYEFFKPKTCIHDPFACTANSNWHRGSSCAQNSAIQQNKKKYKPNDCIFWVGGKKVDDDFTAVWDVAGWLIWYWKKSEQIMVFKQPVSEPCLLILYILIEKKINESFVSVTKKSNWDVRFSIRQNNHR